MNYHVTVLMKMQVETALFFESLEQIYVRVFHMLKPQVPEPRVTVRFRKYASAKSRVEFSEGHLRVTISDFLERAPAPIQEALAYILLVKLFRKAPLPGMLARYRRYMNRADVSRELRLLRQQRGRKILRNPTGRRFDLAEIFNELNAQYFGGSLDQPRLGWSPTCSRATLGHYDPCHNTIVLSSVLDSSRASRLMVEFVLFHEMLHLKYPTQHKGTRRCVHTKEFKTAEAAFERRQEAKEALRELLHSYTSGGKETAG